MDDLIYVAMTGAKESMAGVAIRANNLANASTTGFKADFGVARAMAVLGEGEVTRVYAMTERPGSDFEAGGLISTDRTLDMALQERDGWFVVEDATGGQAYTRAGSFTVSESGQLISPSGRAVIGDGGPIALPPFSAISVAVDGSITIQPLGASSQEIVQVDRLQLVRVKEGGLEKGEDGLFRLRTVPDSVTGALPTAELDGSLRVVSGMLEASNVNTARELVEMISLSRSYESQVKLMGLAEENDEAAAQLLRFT